MRSKEDIIEHFRHELMGIVYDAFRMKETDGAASIKLDMFMAKIRARVGQIVDEARKDIAKQPQQNGKPPEMRPAVKT